MKRFPKANPMRQMLLGYLPGGVAMFRLNQSPKGTRKSRGPGVKVYRNHTNHPSVERRQLMCNGVPLNA